MAGGPLEVLASLEAIETGVGFEAAPALPDAFLFLTSPFVGDMSKKGIFCCTYNLRRVRPRYLFSSFNPDLGN